MANPGDLEPAKAAVPIFPLIPIPCKTSRFLAGPFAISLGRAPRQWRATSSRRRRPCRQRRSARLAPPAALAWPTYGPSIRHNMRRRAAMRNTTRLGTAATVSGAFIGCEGDCARESHRIRMGCATAKAVRPQHSAGSGVGEPARQVRHTSCCVDVVCCHSGRAGQGRRTPCGRSMRPARRRGA